MNVSIKRLPESRWEDLRAIRLRALQSDASVFISNYQAEAALTEAEWRSWLSNDDTAIFLLYDDDVPIGMTGIGVNRRDPAGKTAFMWGSWLEPPARGKGISTLMYEARTAWARQHPTVEKIIVSHRASNLASKHANRKHGFVFSHTVAKVWPDGTRDDYDFYELDVKPPASSQL